MNADAPPSRWDRAARVVETVLLCLLLAILLGLGLTQILLRNLFGGALLWADPVIRAGVLWLGLAGAAAAAREARHIRIDLLSRWLRGWHRAVLDGLTNAFAAGVCAIVAWHAGRLVIDERTYAMPGELLPAWMLQLIIPAAFGLMALFHALSALRPQPGTGPR